MIDRKVSPMEHKLLILYIIRQLGGVTNLQLLQFMVDNAFMDYMTLQLALGELLQAGQLETLPHALGDLYQLTPTGEEALGLFARRVPHSRREAAREAAQAWRRRFELEQQTLSQFDKLPDGQFNLTLTLLEKDALMMRLVLTLPAWHQADLFSRTWPAQAQAVYTRVLRTVGGDYQPQNRQLKDAPGLNILPSPKGEPLMQLQAGGPLSLWLPLPADEDAACHIALRFEQEQAGLLAYLTQQLT